MPSGRLSVLGASPYSRTRALVVQAVALAAAVLPSCGGSFSEAPPPSPAVTATPPPGGPFEYHGLTHVSWWHDGYGSTDGTTSRSHLVSTGVGWAGVLQTWYMDDRRSSSIAPHAQRTPSDEAVRGAIDELRGQGLKVMLKPHMDVLDDSWRGTIEPNDPAAWFESYAAFLSHAAALARDMDVEMLCVGTELATMSHGGHASAWTRVIAEVRAIYPGLLTYAANGNEPGDEFTSVSFWPQLDVLGIDVYTPLTDSTGPTQQQLVSGWRSNRYGHDMVAAYRNFRAAHGKPLIFTEIGYRSADGTNRAPWDWQASMAPDRGEQAECYRAAYEVFSAESEWMNGLFWWSWGLAAPGPGDTGYTPRGKPAEDVLREWQQ